MAEIKELLEILHEEKVPVDLWRIFRSDSVKAGLEKFYLILEQAIEESDGGKLGFESWNLSQTQGVVSIAKSIVSASRSLPVENAGCVIVGIAQLSVAFCICFFEKSGFSNLSLDIQKSVLQLLEIALFEGMDNAVDVSNPLPINTLVESLPIVLANLGRVKVDQRIKCNLRGTNCSMEAKPVDRVLMTLVSDYLQPNPHVSRSTELVFRQDENGMVSVAQHWAVVHVRCIPRLIILCKELLQPPQPFEEQTEDGIFQSRMSFSIRILKLLGIIVKDIPYIADDANLLLEIACCADSFPSLFRPCFDFFSFDLAAAENSLESLMLLLLEEFFQFVQVFCCDTNFFHNVQTCIHASIFDILDAKVWRYDKSTATLKPPLVYSPRIVIYLLKLVGNIRNLTSEALTWKEKLDIDPSGCSSHSEISAVSCHIHYEKVSLLRRYRCEEHLEMIFQQPDHWVDNLMHLAFFLHSQGAKSRQKIDRSRQVCAKSAADTDADAAFGHEDEALFGDLFSEAGRQVGLTDGHDQSPVTANSISSYANLPLQAATEVLMFLKAFLFSPEWRTIGSVNACQKLNENHISILISMLQFQVFSSDERASESAIALALQGQFGRINEVCFDLLHSLLIHHALSGPLEEHLIDQIVKVENGVFVYNDRTLTLLVHALISRAGSAGSHLRTKLYKVYVDFIFEKVKIVCSKCSNLKEIFASLPCIFHIEILLMAFHMSTESEKATLADYVFSALKAIVPPLFGTSTQLSCWSLLVSRLVLVLRHMIVYPSTFPSWLLLRLRTKLREVSSRSDLPHSINDQLPSWASVVIESLVGEGVKEQPLLSTLLHQLIDVAPVPSLVSRDDQTLQCLCLNWDDLCAAFSWITGLWRGKKPEAAEDLILERYIFLLCWDTLSCINCASSHPLPSLVNMLTLDTTNMNSFFLFNHFLVSNCGLICNLKDFNISEAVFRVLQQLQTIHMSSNVKEQNWDFLRSGSWLFLVLSLLQAGAWQFSVKHSIPGVDPYWTDHTSSDIEFFSLAENLVVTLFEGNQIGELFKVLSCLLRRYLQVLQDAFLSTLNPERYDMDGFLPLLLLKHTRFDKCMLDALLKENRSSHLLGSIFGLLSKLDEIVAKEDTKNASQVVLRCLLHGFPSHSATPSGDLVSCILSVEGIISALYGLIKIKDVAGDIKVEVEVLSQLLDMVMAIKTDRIFQGSREKCDAIYSYVISFQTESFDCRDLFLMKHMEKFLKEANSREGINSDIRETLITSFVDIVESIRKDSAKANIFKFYLGSEDNISEQAKGLYSEQRGDLLVLMDAMDTCHTESINLKVLNLFIDPLTVDSELCSHLKEKVQKKFLGMELSHLSKWLEKRLLGCIAEDDSGGTVPARGSSAPLRELTMNFVITLMHPSSEMKSRELHGKFIEAMLLSLDSAFMFYEINSAKAFFNFIVQLCNGQPAMKQLLKKVVMLMEQLAGDDALLQGLKYLLGFLGAVLSACGANKNLLDKLSGKHHSGNSFGSIASRPVGSGSRKGSETLALPTHQETGSALVDCDATSVDEDEDDGTSDGELASVDKDDDADSNSERILASKVCTFTSSGSNFMEQHWYFCYTCDLTFSKGCCSVCAKVCHRGHRVIYSRSSRFFCDCGAGGVRGSTCQCLKPRKFAGSNSITVRGIGNFQPFLPFPENGDQLPDSDSDLDDDSFVDMENMFKLSFPKEEQDELACLLKDLDVEGQVLKICNRLLPAVISRRDSNIAKDQKIILDKDKVLSYSVDILQLKKAYKSRSLDLKIKADYSNSRELKSHLSSGSLIKCLLSVSIRGRLAAGEGDKVAIFDVGQLIGQPTVAPITADKTNVKPLSRNVVQFEIVHLVFNPVVDNYLAVAGYEECQVLTVNPRGEVTDRLAIELALQGAYIRRIDWVPGSQVQLMVVTNTYVKIYDLSLDNISPMHYFTLKDDMIVDAILVMVSQGRMFLLVLSELGCLFRLKLSMEGDVRAKPITETIQVWDKDHQSKGLSLYFSPTCRLLFLSYQDGTTLIGRLDANATVFTEISAVYEDEQDGKLRPAGLHNWREVLAGTGLYVCFSSPRLNAVLAISMGSHKLFAQNMRHTVGSALPLVGITAYRPLSKDKTHVLVLHDDGNLQIFSYIPVGGADTGSNAISDLAKKLGSGILSNRAYAGSNPEFPLDFFEKTVCITQDVKLSGDAIRNGDSEGTKQNLASDDGFLESPSHSGFKVTVLNSNPDIVMVGFCVHVGSTSASHIPSEIAIFQRAIKMDEGMKSWYDIPFTVAEALLADEEFTITIGPTFSVSALPRIDSLEVYGRAKDEFGWKEKMDAVLDMEAHALGSNSGVAGTGKKYRSMQAAPIQEQVIADGLKLLSGYHSLCRSRTCSEIEEVKLELGNLKCKKLLATIFESDREPLLQSAACCVLQAVFPNREIYYHVKDTMRLLGVANASPVLVSRIGVGGSTAGWVIQEFTAQMHVVTSIAFQRRSNMVAFMETHGTGVVDGLMEVLWGILDLEQPETQTINNIVIPSVELIYSYAECLSLHGSDISGCSVAPAVILLRKLLFAPYEAVQTSSSLAISSRLLQVPFPKQTMLATDDVIENSVSAPPSDVVSATGGNTQVMIEEDSTTSSVQYCCDGCSTVPILRRRWHCNVCPDFDLCEACYEVMDADRLPPPHTRDHPMSAIPIEVDSIGADGNEIQFSMDELNESSLLQVSTDIGTQNDPPSIHILEPNEVGDFPTSVNNQRIVSISASKRAVNSLLLRELVENLRGWMKTTSGIHAIPIMQLFYRLSSAVGGPFMDSSKPENLDLEKFVRWFLDEINLNKPFSSKSRSSFGEVVILVFMFFTLMLRNWHQTGSENLPPKPGVTSETQDKGVVQVPFGTSPSSVDDQEKIEFASQLLRACSALRQQAFVNYLMDILQQLVNIFKSPSANLETGHSLPSGSGCGALLTVRKELPAGNFSPFFSDSYAKAHRADFFMDYHRLLLENTFRLIYGLVRPEKQDKSTEKDKVYKASAGKDLKLDEYQDVFCSYINNSHTAFVRRYARRLFLHLCGSKTHYYNIRDSWQLSSEIKRLYKLVNKSGSFRNPVPYERSVKLVKCLSAISEVAEARPRNWQKYCSRHGDVLSFLMNGIFYFMEESVIQTLKLLNLAFYTGEDMCHSPQKGEAEDSGPSSNKAGAQSLDLKKKNKAEDGNDIGSEKSYLDMEQAVEMFTDKDGSVLNSFVESFLLEWNSSSVRVEAKFVLYGIWHHGKHSFKETLLTELLRKVKSLPMYGQNVVEYTELLTWLLGKGISDTSSKQQEAELINSCLTNDVIKCIFETLHSQNELLANHPNSRIYNTLSSLVEFDGYYLESEPCVACSCPEVPYSRTKLESLKSETKFTDNRIIVKCTGSYTILAVTMNIHDARKSKSVKVLNLYYNNRPVADLSELKNNWSMWKRAKSCHLAFNQTDLKVEFPIPITACNFMIELDSFYENLHASSLESLQCPRCSRSVTDKHGICSNCHENAYQCRQCRNINYENLDSFLCNECGYSKYGCFEFNFMAKPSFSFDNMENDEDMKKGLAAIESESENAHRRYQQLLGFKKPLLKLVSSIGENDMDSQQKESVQQMMVSLPGPSCKINRKIALLRVLYGDKCKAAFDSVSKSVQTLQGLRRVLMSYLHQKHSINPMASMRFAVPRSPNNCYGCAITSITQCLELLLVLAKHPNCKKQLIVAGLLSELFENNIHQGPKTARIQARAVLCAFSEGDANAVAELNSLIQKKVMYCLEHHRSMDIAVATREELILLSETFSVGDEFWEARLRVAFQLLFSSIKLGAKHPAISEHIILPCLRIISIACTPPKPDTVEKAQGAGKPTSVQPKDDNIGIPSVSSSGSVDGSKAQSELSETHLDKGQEVQILSYSEWEKGASYLDFVRRQYKVSQAGKPSVHRSRRDSQRVDYLALKYALRWKQHVCKRIAKGDFSPFELGSWVSKLVLSACSQSIRSEICTLIGLLCAQSSSRRFRLLNLLIGLLPATLAAGESAAEYFEILFKMIELEDARLFFTVKGCLTTICRLISQEVGNVESQERSLHIDISQGFILHKLVELLSKFLEVPNIRCRFMRDELLSQVLEALLVIRGLVVQKTKLINDCNRLLKELLDSLLLESSENKRHFIRACISGLQNHGEEKKGRTSLFILEQLCNMICPSKPEPAYLLILNKAHSQEEFIRGSMTKNPYSSTEIGPLMRDVKNKICHQLDLLGLLEDDYGMELLVTGNIISLDLSIAQVYEQVWEKSHGQSPNTAANSGLQSVGGYTSTRDCLPMTVTYRLQGLDGEATEPMIKELEEDREESQDPEVEFAIAGVVQECGGLEIILSMIQRLREDELKANQEELESVLDLLMYCCKIRENRRALLQLGALGLLLETARRAFSVDAVEPAEGLLLIVESLTMEANESDIGITQSMPTVANEETEAGEQAKKIVLMFLERLCHPSGLKKSNKQQRNNEMVVRILPNLTYGELAAMEALIQHFDPYLQNWGELDRLQKQHQNSPKDETLAQQAARQRFALENFVRVSESLKTSSYGERMKDIILEKGIPEVAVRHLRDNFAFSGEAGFNKSSSEWMDRLKLPSTPLILSMLRGLARGHFATQRCIDEGGILPLLHTLEGVSGENEIGARAENLLDTLADKEGTGDGFLREKVHRLRRATIDEMRRRALRKREELLQGLGMRQELASDGGERIVVSQPIIEGLDDVQEEEDGPACMVCREGYSLRPTDTLGVYSYSKRVNLGTSSSGSARRECVYTTVSHFNIIHFQCHQEAKRADAALKNPKKEWEGAALRNNETLCNCIFPLWGPSVPLAQYARHVDQYWDNLSALGRADGSRLRLLTYDVVLMLARFATGASFSTDCKGGGRESNSRLLPFMIQMSRHLLDEGSSNQRRTMAKALSAYLSPPSPADPKPSLTSGFRPPTAAEETVQFMMVNSLLVESYQEWLQHRRTFLQRGIYHTYMQYTHGRSTLGSHVPTPPFRLSSHLATTSLDSERGEEKPAEMSVGKRSENLFVIIQPMLVYTGLIERLQRFFKVDRSGNGDRTAGNSGRSAGEGDGGDGMEEWEVVMKERMLDVKDMVGLSEELLAWLEDMQSAADLQEALEVMGMLDDVLSGGFVSCEEFVQEAIVAGRS